MATRIEYKNKNGESITKEEALIIGDYIEITKEGNLSKIEKEIASGNLTYVTFFKINESIPEILAMFPNDITIKIMSLEQSFGSYQMIKEQNYFNGNLAFMGQILENSIGRQIFFQALSITNGNPIPGTVSKCFYFNKDEYYTFDYNSDGTIKSMDSTYNKNAGCWYLNDLNDLDGFSWSEVGSYYQNAEPITPV